MKRCNAKKGVNIMAGSPTKRATNHTDRNRHFNCVPAINASYIIAATTAVVELGGDLASSQIQYLAKR